MKIKINYLVTVHGELATPETIDSIEKVKGLGDKITELYWDTKSEEEVLNEHIVSMKEDEFTHVCIISDGSIVRDFQPAVNELYVRDPEAVYLSLIELCNEDALKKVVFKGFLNTAIWKPYMVEETGTVDQALGTKGADLMLYGAMLPVSVVKKYKFKPEIKYYSFFEFLNRLIHSEVPVVGIPKVTLRCVKDYELKDVSKEDKLAAWKIATTAYLTQHLI